MQSPISADDTLDREEVFDTNPNTSFARRPLFWICYLIGVAAFIMLVHSIMPVPDLGTTLTITNITHAIVCNIILYICDVTHDDVYIILEWIICIDIELLYYCVALSAGVLLLDALDQGSPHRRSVQSAGQVRQAHILGAAGPLHAVDTDKEVPPHSAHRPVRVAKQSGM